MAQAIRAVVRRGFYVILLAETKIQMEQYSHNHLGYSVICLKARQDSAGEAHGGVGLVTREHPYGWGIESTRFHRQNMISCKIVNGPTLNLFVGTYLPPLTLEQLIDFK